MSKYLEITVGLGVEGYEEALYLDDSGFRLLGLNETQIRHCEEAQELEDITLFPDALRKMIKTSVGQAIIDLQPEYPEYKFDGTYSISFQIKQALN